MPQGSCRKDCAAKPLQLFLVRRVKEGKGVVHIKNKALQETRRRAENNRPMTLRHLLAILFATLVVSAAAWAGPLDTGDAAYKSGDYAQAAALYGQAAAHGHGAEQAKAYYKLGNALHKLSRPADARNAYLRAQSIDPSLSFASSPDKFNSALARVSGGTMTRGNRQGGAVPLGAGGRAVPGGDQAYLGLVNSNVYVSPDVPNIDTQALQQAAVEGKDNPHTIVKIAILSRLPPGFRYDAAHYAGILHQSLNLQKNGLVVAVLSGPKAGVGVATTELGSDKNTQLARQYAPQVAANPTQGMAALAGAVASAVNGKEYGGASILWIVFLIVVAAVAWLVVSATRQKKAQIGQAREQIAPLKQYVLESIGYIDGYLDVLPKNNPDSDTVRTLRQAASDKYDNASKALAVATADSDIARAQGLLNAARADVDNARKALDRALGNTANIPGDDALRPKPLPETQREVNAVPTNQRGVSFFSSRPAPIGSLVPVTVTINGQSKQVLATPEEADELRRGRMPQVRTFDVQGQRVPWYAYNQYDPYNDYWRYQNSGWGGFGGGVVAGLVGAELMGDLFSPRYYGGFGGGYSPYAFSTDNDYYRGYYDAEQSQQAYGSGFDNYGGGGNYDNAGGANFMQDSGPGYDTQDYGSGGGGYGYSGGGSDRS